MPNQVSNALGTERQFTKAPERSYSKQLISPKMSRGINYEDTNSAKLARILNEWADDIPNIMKRREQRIEADESFKGYEVATHPDNIGKEGLTAQAMFANAGMPELLDSPYAMAVVEKYRGENAIRDIRNRYFEEVVLKEGRCPTRKEEMDRWLNFANEKRHEYGVEDIPYSEHSKSYNRFFNIGFYKDIQDYTQHEIAAQSKEAAENRAAIMAGTTQAKFDSITSADYVATHTPEEIAASFTELTHNSIQGGMSITEYLPLLKGGVENLIANGFPPDKLATLGEAECYINPDTTPIHIKDILPMSTYHESAVQMGLLRREKEQLEAYNSLKDSKTLDDFDANTEKLKKEKPEIYSLFAKKGMLSSLRDKKEEDIKWEQRRAMRSGGDSPIGQALSDTQDQILINKGLNWWSDYLNHSIEVDGIPIDSFFQTNNIKPAQRIMIGNAILAKIMNQAAQDGDVKGASIKIARLMNASEMEAFKKSYQSTVSGILTHLDTKDIASMQNDDPVLRTIQLACNMVNANPADAMEALGEKNYNRIERIVILADTNEKLWNKKGDGLRQALQLERNVSTVLADPDSRAAVENKYNAAASKEDATAVDCTSMGGGYDDGVYYLYDPYLNKRISTVATAFIASGMNPDTALYAAKTRVAGEVYRYDGVTIPKAAILGIEADNKQDACITFINNEIAEMGEGTVWKYDYSTNSFTFLNSSTGEARKYTHDKFIKRAGGLYAAYQEQAKKDASETTSTDGEEEDKPWYQDWLNPKRYGI
ncbi:MAG: hypothetical protein E6330_03520 [Dialister sp.]|nr:hypothetical protein [Dialister sp.]